MKLRLTRERVILGGLLLAAGVGLLADQFVFAADSTDAADDYTVSPAGKPNVAIATSPKSVKSAGAVTAEQRLATRLIELAGPTPKSPDELRDVFAPASPQRGTSGDRRGASSAGGANWSKRALNGVLFGADGKGVAIVDGRMVPVGSRLDGLTLIRVSKTVAVFSDGASEIALRIRENSSAAN